MLGEFLSSLTPQGQAPDTPQTESGLGSNLVSTLSQPANRAFLTNFGLQLMTPSYVNNPWSGVAQAIGAGYEGMSAVQRIEQANAEKATALGRAERARDDQLTKDTRDHQQALELEGVRNDGRKEVAGIRRAGANSTVDARTERAAILKEAAAIRKAQSDITYEGDKLGEAQITQEARRRVREASGAGAPTSAVPGKGGGPVGSGGPTEAGKPISPNVQNNPTTSAPDPSKYMRTGKYSTAKPLVVPDSIKQSENYKDPLYRKLLKQKGYTNVED